MAKKVSSFWAYDWESIFRIVIIIGAFVIILFSAFNISYFGMLYRGLGKKGITTATIFARKEIYGNVQTITKGNTTKMDKVRVNYTYNVGNAILVDSCTLSYAFMNSQILNKINTLDLPIQVTVKYKP